MENAIEKIKHLPVTSISDGMNGQNHLNPSIKPVKENLKFAGIAKTVKVPAADNLLLLKAIREAKPYEVIVVDAKGYLYNAACGDFVVGLAKTLGLQGMVIDGAVRDVKGIKDLNYPVFSKGVTVAASYKHGSGEINVPVSCGGVAIHPGDIIAGDEDGVVCIPQSMIDDVVKRACEKIKQDGERERKVLGNVDAVRRYIGRQLQSEK